MEKAGLDFVEPIAHRVEGVEIVVFEPEGKPAIGGIGHHAVNTAGEVVGRQHGCRVEYRPGRHAAFVKRGRRVSAQGAHVEGDLLPLPLKLGAAGLEFVALQDEVLGRRRDHVLVPGSGSD